MKRRILKHLIMHCSGRGAERNVKPYKKNVDNPRNIESSVAARYRSAVGPPEPDYRTEWKR